MIQKEPIIAKGIIETIVSKMPLCNICGNLALYDTKTKFAKWTYLCQKHYNEIGIGVLGTGFGQKLILEDKQHG